MPVTTELSGKSSHGAGVAKREILMLTQWTSASLDVCSSCSRSQRRMASWIS